MLSWFCDWSLGDVVVVPSSAVSESLVLRCVAALRRRSSEEGFVELEPATFEGDDVYREVSGDDADGEVEVLAF